MDLQTQKLQLIEEVLHLESSEQVEQLTSFLVELKHQPEMNFDDIPPMPFRSAEEIKARFEQSLRESDNGEGIPHEQVVALMQRPHAAAV